MRKRDTNTTTEKLLKENALLKTHLEEAEETLRAIRLGEIDALVVKGKHGHQVYTLKGADHTYRILIESMNEGAVIIDLWGVILYANSSFASMIDLPLEKVIGATIKDFIPQKDHDTFGTFLEKSQKRKNNKMELRLQTKEDIILPALFSLTTITLDTNHKGLSVIITDLTKQKQNDTLAASKKLSEQKLFHEKELRSAAERSTLALKKEKHNLQKEIIQRKQLEKQKDEFIGMASHELKTPVTSIKAYTQVLQLRFRKENNMKATELLTKMDTQIDKLTNLIADLLDVTKMDGGKLQFHEGYFDLNEMVEEIVEETQRTTTKHTIQKNLTVSKSLWGDRERLGQVITNFLTNAIKYSPGSDTVIIKTTLEEKYMIVSVQDFGLGIPSEAQKNVFDRFFRVKGDKQETYPGLGLGLYISSEIVRRHHGHIWVESTPGVGSTFYFSLPLKRRHSKDRSNE